jgi:hypothetical protein
MPLCLWVDIYSTQSKPDLLPSLLGGIHGDRPHWIGLEILIWVMCRRALYTAGESPRHKQVHFIYSWRLWPRLMDCMLWIKPVVMLKGTESSEFRASGCVLVHQIVSHSKFTANVNTVSWSPTSTKLLAFWVLFESVVFHRSQLLLQLVPLIFLISLVCTTRDFH